MLTAVLTEQQQLSWHQHVSHGNTKSSVGHQVMLARACTCCIIHSRHVVGAVPLLLRHQAGHSPDCSWIFNFRIFGIRVLIFMSRYDMS